MPDPGRDYSPCLRQGPVHEEIDGFVGAEGQSLSQDPHELSDRDFERDEEFVLVQVNEVGFRGSLDHDRDSIRILLQDLPGLLFPLLCIRWEASILIYMCCKESISFLLTQRMGFFEFPVHGDGSHGRNVARRKLGESESTRIR